MSLQTKNALLVQYIKITEKTLDVEMHSEAKALIEAHSSAEICMRD